MFFNQFSNFVEHSESRPGKTLLMSDFYFKNVENNNSRRLYDITDIFNLVQSVPAWELPAKMQISAAVKPIFHCSGGVFVCVWRGGGRLSEGKKPFGHTKK